MQSCFSNLNVTMFDRKSIIGKVVYLYIDGFRQMTLGRILWTIIIIKLLLVFGVLKLFFFPYLGKLRAVSCECN